MRVDAALDLVFGIGLLGGLIGGMIFGLACDRVGRKPCLLLTIAIFGAMSLPTPWVSTVGELRRLRLLTGFGLGGTLPCILALTFEFAPRRTRTKIVSWMFCGFPLGAVVGGVTAALLLPTFGWRSIFLLGGAVPLLALPAIALTMPESIRFLALRRDKAYLARVLARMGIAQRGNGEIASAAARGRFPLGSLFTEARAVGTLLIWATLFLSLLMAYFLLNAVKLGRVAHRSASAPR